jgi:CheY-like chemotaxis protein
MEFRAEPADLPLLVDSVVQGLRATAFEKHLQIEVAVDAVLENVILDPARFKQVLYNYVSNALKFTPDGGRISVRVEPDGTDHFRVEVEDNGVGISPEDVSRLFVEFQQLDSSTAKRHGGTGLGLALTKRLAEAQGGTVGVRPADGHGSVFFAVLPRRPAGFTDPLPRRDYTRLGTSVLVVEDDPADRAVLVRTLREAGYVVEAVSNCAEAAAAWQKGRHDAITLDLLLPDSDRLQDLLRLVRDDDTKVKVPVIAITVVAEGSAVAGFEVNDVLTKPVESTKLLHALERGGVLPTHGRPVLVVDDDAGSLKLMEATLASLGHDALCCADAREALRALQHVRPVAVIVDLIMPEMDGFAFLERFRALPENDRIPAMVWTIKDLSAEERRDLERAVSAVVQKGVEDGSRLSVALRALLSSRDSTEEHEP